MFELGEKEKELHKGVGAHAAEKEIDVLVAIGALSKNTADGAKDRNPAMHVLHFDTKADFLKESKCILKTNDTVLVKASHGMEFPEIVEALRLI